MSKSIQRLTYLKRTLTEVARDSIRTSFDLFKIMVPVIVLMRLLDQAGVVKHLGNALGPVMELIGLPGETGLIWATAMITNLYGGAAVFVSLDLSLTVAQATVLTTIMLIAHGLAVELRIAQKAGVRFRVMGLLRAGGGFLAGWILYHAYRITGSLEGPSRAVFKSAGIDPTWVGWGKSQAIFLVKVLLIIFCLMLVVRVLKAIGLMSLFARLLELPLRLLGMSPAAAPVTVIGMVLGLTYGGGLIIQEARSGILSKRDVFFSIALMSLSHSLIEDTILMMLLGGHISGILIWRVVFSLAVIVLLVRAMAHLSDKNFIKFFCRPT